MSREEAISRLISAQECADEEIAHWDADKVLCDLLDSLGFADVVEEWEKVEKWYA